MSGYWALMRRYCAIIGVCCKSLSFKGFSARLSKTPAGMPMRASARAFAVGTLFTRMRCGKTAWRGQLVWRAGARPAANRPDARQNDGTPEKGQTCLPRECTQEPEFEILGFALGWPSSDYSQYHTQQDRIQEREVRPISRKN